MSRLRDMGDRAEAPARGAGAQPLIHNMSCRPTVTVTHTGVAQCTRLLFTSALLPGDGKPLEECCAAFGLTAPAADLAYARLMEAASEPCPLLARLPPVAAVMRNTHGQCIPGLTDDPRLLLAVMSRCFGHVFMRDLPPSITSDSFRLQVTLLVPKSWNLNP